MLIASYALIKAQNRRRRRQAYDTSTIERQCWPDSCCSFTTTQYIVAKRPPTWLRLRLQSCSYVPISKYINRLFEGLPRPLAHYSQCVQTFSISLAVWYYDTYRYSTVRTVKRLYDTTYIPGSGCTYVLIWIRAVGGRRFLQVLVTFSKILRGNYFMIRS